MRAVLSHVLACVGAAPKESPLEPDSDLESLLEPPPKTAARPWTSPAAAATAVLGRLRQSQTAASRTPAHSTDDVC